MRSLSSPAPEMTAVHRPVILRTWTDVDAVAVVPFESVTVATTVKSPVAMYVCTGASPAPSPPSPNFHANVYGATPPVGDVAYPNVNTVAAATPMPLGDAPGAPGVSVGVGGTG